MTFPFVDPCGNVTPIDLELQIQDVAPVEVQISKTQMLCPGDQGNTTAVPSGGSLIHIHGVPVI